MADIAVNVVGPVAVLVLLGALTGPRLNIDAGQLSRLAYWVLGPAFMFDALAKAELERTVVARLVIVSLLAMAAAAVVAAVGAKSIGLAGTAAGSMMMSSAYGNVGNAGLAISIFALGESIKPAASLVMLVVNSAGLVIGVGLASRQSHGLGSALRRALTAPMALAAAAAIAFNYLNTQATVELPTLADRVITILAGALIPLMLYTLGIQLMNQGRPRISADVGVVGVAKLAVAPAAAALAASAIGLEGDFFDVVVIQSAMPPAVFTAVVALEHNFEIPRVTTFLVATSLMSLITLPIVLTLV